MAESRYKSYKIFYDSLALLHMVANQRTMFFASLLSRMNNNNEVHLTPYERRTILIEIGSKSKNPLAMAKDHLQNLAKSGLVTSIGGGSYMVNPKFATKYEDFTGLVDAKYAKYLTIIGSSNGEISLEVEDVTEAEVIPITKGTVNG